MNNPFAFASLLICSVLAVGTNARAQSPAPTAPRELTIVVVDSLRNGAADEDAYERIARNFTKVFEKRNWPVKIDCERFAGNLPDYPTELRVFYQGIRELNSGELTFIAWMTLTDHGTKHDFGVIRYRYSIRPYELADDRFDNLFRGAAQVAAAKIEPILFPSAAAAKP